MWATFYKLQKNNIEVGAASKIIELWQNCETESRIMLGTMRWKRLAVFYDRLKQI